MATAVQLPADISTDFATRLTNFNTSSERGTLLETPGQVAGKKRKMSFGVASFGNSTGTLSAMKYNGQSTPVRQSQSSTEGNIIGPYTAVYSGISVYEMSVNDMIVMRRRADSWLNATQILKIAGVDKGKRTKVLEKEILSGEHEKVQGGYGRYQGTWVNYKRGRDFCRAYGVEEVLRPLLDYDMGQDGEAPGEGIRVQTPTKEQAMAAQRKKILYNGPDKAHISTPNTTFFQGISPVAASAITALSKARLDSPGLRTATGTKRSASVRNSENNSHHASQQSTHSESSFNIDPALGNGPYFAKPANHSGLLAEAEPPRKRARPGAGLEAFGHTNGDMEQSYRERSPTEPNESFMYPQADGKDDTVGLPPLPEPTTRSDIAKQHVLASLFLDPTRENLDDVTGIDNLSGNDFDIPIDQGGHTALHWAATLARPSMLKALAARGANIFRVNSGGETALMRAVRTTNNLDQNTFAEILEPLGPTIAMRDHRRQTILHHLATTSAIRGRSSACRYYLDSLLEFVVKQGNASSSQPASHSHEHTGGTIGLARFMSDIVNAQDIAGDTALNLAARINNKSIIQQLLEIGANPSIPNRGGLKPLDFGVGIGENVVVPMESKDSSQDTMASSQANSQNRVAENSKHLLDALKTLITDTELSFRSELQAKQSLIDQEQAHLRSLTASLTDDQAKLRALEARANTRATLRHQIATLRRLNSDKKRYLSENGNAPLTDVSVGDADNGLAIDTSLLRPLTTEARTAEQEAYLRSIPVSYVLSARTRAYQTHNKTLEARQQDLETKSTMLEQKVRRAVTICTGIDENDIEEKADRLAAALQSEEGEPLDMARVRDFLRRLEDGE